MPAGVDDAQARKVQPKWQSQEPPDEFSMQIRIVVGFNQEGFVLFMILGPYALETHLIPNVCRCPVKRRGVS